MTEARSRPNDETWARIASYFAEAFAELQESLLSAVGLTKEEQDLRAAIEELSRRFEASLGADMERQRHLDNQLISLASLLERLVIQLQDLSEQMSDLVERLGAPFLTSAPIEKPFPVGGEGLNLALTAVTSFQALMDIQKALSAMDQIAGVSVERYQEGDARLLLHLRAPVTATQITGQLRTSTPYAGLIEESRPELSRLRVKIVISASA